VFPNLDDDAGSALRPLLHVDEEKPIRRVEDG
jgi:hypothetical protein